MNILFICTGNTCRSPMAEYILRNLAKQEGMEVDVKSAGVSAMDGMSASQHVEQVLKEKEIEVNHSSQLLTEKLVDWADLILTMTQNHKQVMKSHFPQSVEKVYILKEYVEDDQKIEKLEREMLSFDISDPFGGSIELYRKTAAEVEEVLKKLINKLE